MCTKRRKGKNALASRALYKLKKYICRSKALINEWSYVHVRTYICDVKLHFSPSWAGKVHNGLGGTAYHVDYIMLLWWLMVTSILGELPRMGSEWSIRCWHGYLHVHTYMYRFFCIYYLYMDVYVRMCVYMWCGHLSLTWVGIGLWKFVSGFKILREYIRECSSHFIPFMMFPHRLGHGDIEDEQRSMPLRVETFLMLKYIYMYLPYYT